MIYSDKTQDLGKELAGYIANKAKTEMQRDFLNSLPETERYKVVNPNYFQEASQYKSTVNTDKYDPVYEFLNTKDISKSGAYNAAKAAAENLGKLTQAELDTYNYLHSVNGSERATEYLDSLKNTLNQRAAQQKYEEEYQGDTLKEIAFGFSSGLENFAHGAASFLDAINPFSEAKEKAPTENQYLASMVREDLADDGVNLPDWLGGASIAQLGFDAANTVGNMLPSIGVGVLNPIAGAATMGVSSAGNAYQAAINSGHNRAQASLYGLLVGASEAGLQYAMGGISKLGKGTSVGQKALAALSKADNALGNFATTFGNSIGGKLLMNGLSEGAEEGLQAVLEPFFASIAMGEDFTVEKEEALYNALMGFFMGVGFGLTDGDTYRKTPSLPSTDTNATTEQQPTFEEMQQGATTGQVAAPQNEIQPGNNAPDVQAQEPSTQTQPPAPEQGTGAKPGTLDWVLQLAQLGSVSNKQAQKIVEQPDLYQQILELAGIESPNTQSGKRNAVKQAVAQIGQPMAQQAPQTAQDGQSVQTPTDTTQAPNAPQNFNAGALGGNANPISIADFTNNDSNVWNNVDYDDKQTQADIMNQVHEQMVAEGSVVQVPKSVRESVEDSYPDLRSMKKKDRTPILKAAIQNLKTSLRSFLSKLKDVSFEFEVNGNILEARLYNTGINEVLEKVTQQKAEMLFSTEQIFQNARYLYSTPDYGGDPNVYRWNYFYTPVQIGSDTVGVRIAVRDVAEGEKHLPESQIYNWGIKKDTSLDGVGPVDSDSSYVVSSDVSDNSISKTVQNVNPDYSVGAAPAGFNPNSHLQYKYGTMPEGENPVRPDDLPVRDVNGDPISKSAGTVKGAKVTPDAFVPLLDRMATGGALSYIPITNNATTQAAIQKIMKNGWAETLGAWEADVRNGKASAEMVATGALLLNNAAQAGDRKTWRQVLYSYQQLSTTLGQGLQAMRILKTLKPSDKLYMIKRSIKELNENIAAKNKKRRPSEKDNVPVEQWMQKTGEILAERLKAAASTKSQKAQTVSQTVLNDLQKVARQTVKTNTDGITRRSDFDLIRDMLANKENYQKALTAAKETVQKEYGNDRAVMNALSDWMKTELDPAKMLVDQLSYGQYKDEPIVLSDDLAQEFLDAQTDEEADAALDKIAKDVAKQIKTTWGEKWTALRYLNMLGNFRTQIRNFAGNATMGLLNKAKNAVAVGIEAAANKISGGKIERTKSLTVTKDKLNAAKADYDIVADVISNGGRYNDPNAQRNAFMQKVQDNKQVFAFKPLEGYRKAINWMMNNEIFGDAAFSKPAYARALAGYLKAKGITETDLSKIDPKIMDDARLYAVKEAQEVTFRDNNWLSTKLSKIGRNSNNPETVKAIIDGIIPFRKTPANVLIRAVEYSPLSLATNVAKTGQAALSNTKLAEMDNMVGRWAAKGGEINANTLIDSWAKSLTGSGLFFLGMLMFNNGWLNVGPDDDEQKAAFDRINGVQPYSLNIPIGDKTYTYTIDWASPAAVPILMGGELMKAIGEDGFQLEDLTDALTSITDPLIEMSMLQGVNDTLEDIKYSENPLGQIFINAALSYLTQGITNTALGQIERSFEDSRMTTYVDKDSALPSWLQQWIGKVSPKKPGWDYQQIPYINAWGEEDKNMNAAVGLAYNMLSPGYVDLKEDTPLTRELYRLNKAQGENVFPPTMPKDYTVKGEKINLTAEQYVEAAKMRGQTQKQLVQDLIDSEEYAGLTEKEKAKAITTAYDYALEYTKSELFGTDTVPKWMAERPEGMTESEAIIRHVTTGTTAKYSTVPVDVADHTVDILDALQPESGSTVRTIQKLEAVISDKKLADYKEALILEIGDSKLDAKYKEAKGLGYSPEDFVTAYRIYLDEKEEGGKGTKERTIQEMQQEFGVSYEVAKRLYEVYG